MAYDAKNNGGEEFCDAGLPEQQSLDGYHPLQKLMDELKYYNYLGRAVILSIAAKLSLNGQMTTTEIIDHIRLQGIDDFISRFKEYEFPKTPPSSRQRKITGSLEVVLKGAEAVPATPQPGELLENVKGIRGTVEAALERGRQADPEISWQDIFADTPEERKPKKSE